MAAESLLISKQQNQMQALRKKLEGQLQQDRNTRDADHNTLLQKYQNVKKELEL